MEDILPRLADFGALGLIAAFLLWQNSKINASLMKIIADNTMALVELKSIIENCFKKDK